ncbi:hypothetical protein RLEG3_02705 (plasmid) [Rhizobium leguminosarum bv. trifolii WSM1689]|nr:hypothetical protein RLEG3_02705 [Rhizobium leguminosarum bv. trifolii WSM1689]
MAASLMATLSDNTKMQINTFSQESQAAVERPDAFVRLRKRACAKYNAELSPTGLCAAIFDFA